MSHRLLVALLLLAPATASADAIMRFDGECFPGSRRGIEHHSEACIPIACQGDGECGDGARCETLCVCRAEREFRSNGRVVYPEPRRMVVEVGLCDASGACAEGDVSSRRQCEPTEDTPAFDRRMHRWTRQPHVASSPLRDILGGGDDHTDPPASSTEAPSTEEEGSGGGCAVGGSRASGSVALALLGLALARIRRRRR